MSASPFDHSICDGCWRKEFPAREPHRMIADASPAKTATLEQCCFCGEIHTSGIYIRRHPLKCPCKGVHAN